MTGNQVWTGPVTMPIRCGCCRRGAPAHRNTAKPRRLYRS